MTLREALAMPCTLYPPYYQSEHFQNTTYVRFDGCSFLVIFLTEIQRVILHQYELIVKLITGETHWILFESIEELEMTLLLRFHVPSDEGWQPHNCEPPDSVPEETAEEREISQLLADLIPSDEDWEFQGKSE